MKIRRKINNDLYPWRIWTRLYDKSGNLLGECQSVQIYEHYGSAMRAARQMYAGPFEGIRFEWVVAKTCPWVHEQIIVIELTHDELAEAYDCHEHHCDCEYVRNCLNSGCYEEFKDLSDEELEKAVSEIACEKREMQDKDGCYETCALDAAIASYVKEHLHNQSETE